MNNKHNIAAVFIASAGVILFSTKAVIIKLAYQYDVDAITLLLFRMLFALPFYGLIWFLRRGEWKLNPLSTKQKFSIFFLGLIGYYLASFFDFKGLTLITASLERLILFSYPTIVLIMSYIFLKKKISRIQILSILITYFGIAIIFYDKGGITAGNSEDVLWGSIYVGLSAISYAIYLVGSHFLIAKIGTVRLTTFSMIVSCLVVIVHYLITTGANLLIYQAEVYWLSFLMAIFATVIPSFLINEGIHRIGASNISIIGSLGPVSTITLSMIFLGEMLTLLQFGGTLVIVSGVIIISLNKK